VDLASSDIDVVLIAPLHITREDFFEIFGTVLSRDTRVSRFHPAPFARVPLITIVMDGVEVDVLFSSMSFYQSGRVKEMDSKSEVSLGGVFVSYQIHKILDEHPSSRKSFQALVRFVKQWAKERRVYGQTWCFPGGISWAVLCLKIHEMYPRSTLNVLIRRFFQTYANWDWSESVAIRDETCSIPSPMMVLPPGYKTRNSTDAVSMTTLRILVKEFSNAARFAEMASSKQTWELLFKTKDKEFFSKHSHFLEIVVLAEEYKVVESKLRAFFKHLEQSLLVKISPFAKWFDHPSKEEKRSYIALSLRSGNNVTWREIEKSCQEEISNSLSRLEVDNVVQCKIRVVTRSRLPYFVCSSPCRAQCADLYSTKEIHLHRKTMKGVITSSGKQKWISRRRKRRADDGELDDQAIVLMMFLVLIVILAAAYIIS